MSMPAVTAMCICGCLLALLLGQYQRPAAVLLSLAVCVLLVLSLLPQMQGILETAELFFGDGGLPEGYFFLLCRAAGISFLTQLGIDFCRDCGQTAIGSAVELCGRVSLLVLAMPLFSALARLVLEVIG